MRKNCLAEARLKLKEGAQVMCIKNLNVGAGVCNGSKGVVIGFTPPDEEAPPGSSAGRQGWPIVRFANGVEQVSSSELVWWCRDSFCSLESPSQIDRPVSYTNEPARTKGHHVGGVVHRDDGAERDGDKGLARADPAQARVGVVWCCVVG